MMLTFLAEIPLNQIVCAGRPGFSSGAVKFLRDFATRDALDAAELG